MLVYQSGLLSDLPAGLIAPRCLAITEYPANEHWLWQEDMAVENKMPWSLEQYGIAAHHLGLFNGGYLTGQSLTGQSLPNHSWLRQSDTQQRLALAEPGIPQLLQLCANPHFAGLIDEDQVRRIHRLWEQRQRLLTALETLPKTFCHFDAFPRNLIARHDLAGHELAGTPKLWRSIGDPPESGQWAKSWWLFSPPHSNSSKSKSPRFLVWNR